MDEHMRDEELRKAALEYHRLPTPGKISIAPTKGLINQRDLALAYSPGVAAACDAIAADPAEARALTSRGNLVGVVTNGTAVLGLGNIGPLAAQAGDGRQGVPVQEVRRHRRLRHRARRERSRRAGRARSRALEPTFGGINLEDIKAPECFYIERKLRERHEDPGLPRRPARHRDRRRRAAMLNGLKVVGKEIGEVKLVCSGAGAAAIACLDLLVGARR